MMREKKNQDLACWDYRIVNTEEGYGVFEVYYDRDGAIEGYSSFSLEGFTPQELKVEVEEIQRAFSKPVLEAKDIEQNVWMNILAMKPPLPFV
jgi:hypothetical protein